MPHAHLSLGPAAGAAALSQPVVVAVCRSAVHGFAKPCESAIQLRVGLGIDGDSHQGRTVQHLARVRRDPAQPNLRQVHLIPSELLAELLAKGFVVRPGELGENITTEGLDVLALPRGARLHIGEEAIIEVTGLRNPCAQLDDFQPGLMRALLDHDAQGALVRKAGIMSIVIADGIVRPGDMIRVEPPAAPHQPLEVV